MSDVPVRKAVVTVRLPEGLHLRPLTQLARLAQSFTAAIVLEKPGIKADAKRPLDLMTLAAGPGEQLQLEAVGTDADAAVDAIVRLFERDFADDTP